MCEYPRVEHFMNQQSYDIYYVIRLLSGHITSYYINVDSIMLSSHKFMRSSRFHNGPRVNGGRVDVQ